MQLPIPDPIARAHSEKLTDLIRQEIQQANGALSFARFMELALYAPGLGYYSAGKCKLGAQGDFVTAPEITPLFAKSIARQFQQVLAEIPHGDILEFGAGSGVFAKEVLLELEKLNTLPEHYLILEISADLRERQQQLLKKHIPHLFDRIVWLDTLPAQPIDGIIFANEVLDALPVHLFQMDKQLAKERCVTWKDNQFSWQLAQPSHIQLQYAIEKLHHEYNLPDGYQSELSLTQPAWLQSIISSLRRGVVLLLDYGYGGAEYYCAERTMGTLMCFYQHRKHDNPLELVGLQDMTAHVNFSHLLDGLDPEICSLSGFTTQADFLFSCGLLTLVEQENITDSVLQYQQAQAIKKLILPGEMGELIKVMALQKNMSLLLLGFMGSDRRRDL